MPRESTTPSDRTAESDLHELEGRVETVRRGLEISFAQESEGRRDRPVSIHNAEGLMIADQERWYSESEVVDVVVARFPEPGLVASVKHWSVPPGAVLHVFIPARGESFNVLDRWEDKASPSGWSHDNTFFVLLEENLRTAGFCQRWAQIGPLEYYVPLYDSQGMT